MDVKLKENLRVGASWLSVLSFWWLKEIFTIGHKRPIRVDDLYAPLPEDRSEVLSHRLERCPSGVSTTYTLLIHVPFLFQELEEGGGAKRP